MSFTSNVNKTFNLSVTSNEFVNNIFNNNFSFEETALKVFYYQYHNNKIYSDWCHALHVSISKVQKLEGIPFLPVSFFKSNKVVCGEFNEEQIFESSGTTKTINSKHYVKDTSIYKKSFLKSFELFYGNIEEYCIIGLLPSYLERNNSSLVFMVNELIKLSKKKESGFYLHNLTQLYETLNQLENKKQKTILFGVTFALLDLAETFQMKLQNTIIIETGGMKGRKKELTSNEVHTILNNRLQPCNIHSEYGMTELLSQAYSTNNGIYKNPPWLKMLVRNEDDPMEILSKGKGILNIIDLANLYSCAFIAVDDAAEIFENNSFKILGRIDNSDIRGCSLLAL